MPKDKEIRSRGWCFTWNNWTPENRATMESIVCTYIIFGEETAPTTGTPHLQGYVYFANARSLTSVRKIDGKISWRAAKGDAQQNFDYCTKDGRNVHERGVAPKTATEKGDDERQRWRDVIRLAELGDMDTLREEHPTFISTSSAASTLFTRHASEASRTLMASLSTSGLLALAAAASLVLLAMRTLVLLLN